MELTILHTLNLIQCLVKTQFRYCQLSNYNKRILFQWLIHFIDVITTTVINHLQPLY